MSSGSSGVTPTLGGVDELADVQVEGDAGHDVDLLRRQSVGPGHVVDSSQAARCARRGRRPSDRLRSAAIRCGVEIAHVGGLADGLQGEAGGGVEEARRDVEHARGFLEVGRAGEWRSAGDEPGGYREVGVHLDGGLRHLAVALSEVRVADGEAAGRDGARQEHGHAKLQVADVEVARRGRDDGQGPQQVEVGHERHDGVCLEEGAAKTAAARAPTSSAGKAGTPRTTGASTRAAAGIGRWGPSAYGSRAPPAPTAGRWRAASCLEGRPCGSSRGAHARSRQVRRGPRWRDRQ